MRVLLFLLLPLSLATTLAAAPAQLNKVGEIVLAPNQRASGVTAFGQVAYVSLHDDGVTHTIDLTFPNAPTSITSFNPAFGDQFHENVVINGRLFCGHRFGGLNMWDVSNPNLPAQLDTTGTNYHHDGLEVRNLGVGQILFYSEHNAGAQPGGLHVYDVTGGSLNLLGTSLVGNNLRDGRFLKVTSDQWVYQFDGGAGSTRPLMLNVYDCQTINTPTMVLQFNLGNALGNYTGGTDLELHPSERVLYAACQFDGLRVVDIGVRNAPVVVNTLGANGFQVKELDYALGTVFMVGSVVFPNGQHRFRILDCTVPTNPVLFGNWMGDPNYSINDLFVHWLPGGPAVLVAGRNAAGEATMQVWM